MVVASTRSPVVPNPAKNPPEPAVARTLAATSRLVARTTRPPARIVDVITPVPSAASVARATRPVDWVAPAAARPSTIPICSTSSRVVPVARIVTSASGSRTLLPVAARAAPAISASLWLTVTATPPTDTATEWALTFGLEVAASTSPPTPARFTPSRIVASRLVASFALAITTPTAAMPSEPPLAWASSEPSGAAASSLAPRARTVSGPDARSVAPVMTVASNVEESVVNAWPPAPAPPRATAAAVATVSVASVLPPRASSVIPPAVAVTRAFPIDAVTRFAAVVSVSDTPIDPPAMPTESAPEPNVFFVTRSWSRAVTDTLPALTVPAAISAVTVLPSVTRERPPDPAKAPLNSPIVAAAATATPSDVTFACDSAVSTTAFAAVTSGAAPWSAAAIRARTVSRIVVSRITTPGASDTPLPIVTASAPAPARDVIAGLSMAETDTDPACDVTLAESTSAATVLESVVKTLAPEPAPEIPSPVTATVRATP